MALATAIPAFYNGIQHKPETTFGNVKADVPADKDPHSHRGNFCSVIRCSSVPLGTDEKYKSPREEGFY